MLSEFLDEVAMTYIAAVLPEPLPACEAVPRSQDAILWCRAISLLHPYRGGSAGCPCRRLLLKGW